MSSYEQMRKLERIIVGSLVALVAVVCVAIYSFISLGRARYKSAEYDRMIASLNAQKTAIEQNIDHVNSDEYLEELARNHLGMIKDGETLYVFD